MCLITYWRKMGSSLLSPSNNDPNCVSSLTTSPALFSCSFWISASGKTITDPFTLKSKKIFCMNQGINGKIKDQKSNEITCLSLLMGDIQRALQQYNDWLLSTTTTLTTSPRVGLYPAGNSRESKLKNTPSPTTPPLPNTVDTHAWKTEKINAELILKKSIDSTKKLEKWQNETEMRNGIISSVCVYIWTDLVYALVS